MATIDIKLKTYEQLQFEISKLMIDNFLKQQELEKYKNIVDEAIKYNKELCELYDCGMELSNAQTNLVILEADGYKLNELKGAD